jgi:hypothetical protein
MPVPLNVSPPLPVMLELTTLAIALVWLPAVTMTPSLPPNARLATLTVMGLPLVPFRIRAAGLVPSPIVSVPVPLMVTARCTSTP